LKGCDLTSSKIAALLDTILSEANSAKPLQPVSISDPIRELLSVLEPSSLRSELNTGNSFRIISSPFGETTWWNYYQNIKHRVYPKEAHERASISEKTLEAFLSRIMGVSMASGKCALSRVSYGSDFSSKI
jgi:hypothetical protein